MEKYSECMYDFRLYTKTQLSLVQPVVFKEYSPLSDKCNETPFPFTTTKNSNKQKKHN